MKNVLIFRKKEFLIGRKSRGVSEISFFRKDWKSSKNQIICFLALQRFEEIGLLRD